MHEAKSSLPGGGASHPATKARALLAPTAFEAWGRPLIASRAGGANHGATPRAVGRDGGLGRHYPSEFAVCEPLANQLLAHPASHRAREVSERSFIVCYRS
jgi:hypothetical protein